MANKKVLGCLIAANGCHVIYYQESKELSKLLATSKFFHKSTSSDSAISSSTNAQCFLEMIQAAKSDTSFVSMPSSECKLWYRKDYGLQTAIIIRGRCLDVDVQNTMKQIGDEISAQFEDEDEIPLYILRIRCKTISTPILRQFQRRSVENLFNYFQCVDCNVLTA